MEYDMDNGKPVDCNLLWDRTNMTWTVRDGKVEMYSGIWPVIHKEHDITDLLEKRYNVKIKKIFIR